MYVPDGALGFISEYNFLQHMPQASFRDKGISKQVNHKLIFSCCICARCDAKALKEANQMENLSSKLFSEDTYLGFHQNMS